MAYSEKAKSLRKCTGTRKDGRPCKAWATWSDPRQLCVSHAGRHHRGPIPKEHSPSRSARYTPCCCPAYQWPHRPGGGLCEWPQVPEYRCTVPQGSKNPMRSVMGLGRQLHLARRTREELEILGDPETGT